MSREQLIGLIQSDAKFMDEREDITDYVRTLKAGEGLTRKHPRRLPTLQGREARRELAAIADKHGLTTRRCKAFVDGILDRMIFDGEQLTDLMEPLDLGWRERREKELALMDDLVPLLKKRADGRDISGPQRLRAMRGTMTADKQTRLVPRLRFPEFRRQGSGRRSRLADHADRFQTGLGRELRASLNVSRHGVR